MLALSQLTVKNVLVQRIRDEIIRGHFSPGERLPLRDLAKQFDVSTQPIRQALSELEAEGLVKSEARKGAFVTSLTPAELDDIYEIRAPLEAMATEVAVSHLTDGTLDRLDQLIVEIDRHLGEGLTERREVVELVRLNYKFHDTIYAASGRQHLLQLTRTLRHRTQHYLHAYMIEQDRMPHAQDEHRAIVLACRERDGKRAKTMMYEHVTKAGRGIIEYVKGKAN